MTPIKPICFFLFISYSLLGFSQQKEFTHQDTLRGTITPERAWWDLTYYHLSIKVNINKKSIAGSNVVQYKVLSENKIMQIELQEPLKIIKVIQNEMELKVKKDGYTYFIELQEKQSIGAVNELTIYYEAMERRINLEKG